MQSYSYSGVLVLALLGAASGGWIRCPQDDKLSQCTGEAFVRLINMMTKGDPSIDLPVLDPLTIPVMDVNKNAGTVLNINMTLTDLKVTKIARDVVLKSATFDLDKLVFDAVMFRPQVDFNGNYKLNGKVLWLPIWGKGTCQMKMKNVYEKFHLEGKKVEKDGKTYWNVTRHFADLEPELLTVQYNNLFNGNVILGRGANALLNSQWKAIYAQLEPITDAKFSSIMEPYFRDLVMQQPLDEAFPAA